MVRAILEGRKTVTRRVMNPQPEFVWGSGNNGEAHVRYPGGSQPDPWIKCPYGQVGDRLWVREAWFDNCPGYGPEQAELYYKADGLPDFDGEESELRWRPSIHMPRWASRLTLEIVSVRVERLQDISEADAIAEGGVYTDTGKNRWGQQANGWSHRGNTTADTCLLTAKFSFWNLWDSINGSGSWDANPWVWVVEFKVVQP